MVRGEEGEDGPPTGRGWDKSGAFGIPRELGRSGKLRGQMIGGAIGGGVVTYTVNGTQKVAVAHGLTSILWPTPIATAKVATSDLKAQRRE